jgi:phosphoribosylamine--glycine ligase
LGDNIKIAQEQAYNLVKQVNWQDVYYRQDIGYRAIKRLS